jgi:signal transduction histidine kinase
MATERFDDHVGDIRIDGEDEDYLLTSVPAGSALVLVAGSAEGVEEASGALTGLLAVGAPFLVLLLGVATWFVVGRALSPVEAIRKEVESITVHSLDRRVPVVGDDEVGRLAKTMNAMLGRVDRAVVRQRMFVADASHELRSPLASLRQNAEVASAHPERTDVSRLADDVLAETVRMQSLVEGLLVLARVDEGSGKRQTDVVDVDDLVVAEAARLRDRVQVGTPGLTAVQVHGVSSELDRVVRNLGTNAARHARSRVELTVEERGDLVVIAVDDDGDGIRAADRSRVLDRFVRLDEARDRDSGGSGLGLSIADELVRAHGGRIVVTDSRLGGARVEVHLPAFSQRSAVIRHGGNVSHEEERP